MGTSETGWVSGEESDAAWQATMQGRYEEALRLWDTIVERQRQAGWHHFMGNRGIARLLAGDTQGALADFLEYRNWPYPGKWPVPFVGTILWLQGERTKACEDWAHEISRRRSGEITHCDEGGGIEVPALLWWASAHEGLDKTRGLAVKELRDRDRRNRRGLLFLRRWEGWPGVLAPFLLGTTAEEALLPHVKDSRPFPAVRRCQAHFYTGARHLDAGSLAAYQRCLERAVSQGENSIVAPEYHLARAELRALNAGSLSFPSQPR